MPREPLPKFFGYVLCGESGHLAEVAIYFERHARNACGIVGTVSRVCDEIGEQAAENLEAVADQVVVGLLREGPGLAATAHLLGFFK